MLCALVSFSVKHYKGCYFDAPTSHRISTQYYCQRTTRWLYGKVSFHCYTISSNIFWLLSGLSGNNFFSYSKTFCLFSRTSAMTVPEQLFVKGRLNTPSPPRCRPACWTVRAFVSWNFRCYLVDIVVSRGISRTVVLFGWKDPCIAWEAVTGKADNNIEFILFASWNSALLNVDQIHAMRHLHWQRQYHTPTQFVNFAPQLVTSLRNDRLITRFYDRIVRR